MTTTTTTYTTTAATAKPAAAAPAPTPAAPELDDAFLAEVRAFIGRGTDREGFAAPAPVSAAQIRQMVQAVGDRNPIYSDEAAARASVHGALVAPPLWMYSWMMAGLAPQAEEGVLADGTRYFHNAAMGQRRAGATVPTVRDEMNTLLESRGFASPVVTDTSYTFERYLRPGEWPRFSSWIIDDVVGPKTTKVGVGFFVSLRLEVYVGDERVATIKQRYLRAKPNPVDSSATTPRPALQVPADVSPEVAAYRPVSVPHTPRFADIHEGEQLPGLVVKVSPTLIIAGALASQDYQDVHHDFLYIPHRGHPTVFMNMMAVSGLVGRFVTDWSGPNCIVRGHTLRLGRPNYAGDVLRLAATVSKVEEVDGRRLATVDFTGENSLGRAIDGNVVVEFPR